MLSNQDQSGARSVPWREPVWQAPARLGWRVRYTEVVFADPAYALMQATPVFPGCHPKVFERGIVWDPLALLEAARRPGGHDVLTADCGYAPDVHIEDAVRVSHPDAHTIVWELDLNGLRPALDEAVTGDAEDGFIRLVFEREAFEADLRALLRELQAKAAAPVPLEELTQAYDWGVTGLDQATLANLPVGEFEPDSNGLALETLQALDPDAVWPREPIWPAGTLVEFGYFEGASGHELMRINGEVLRPGWPGWFFPRWEALHAFRIWVQWTTCEVSWPPAAHAANWTAHRANLRFLRQEADRAPCHAAGRRLAEVMQACLTEGDTAPEVAVRYVECPLAADAVPQGKL